MAKLVGKIYFDETLQEISVLWGKQMKVINDRKNFYLKLIELIERKFKSIGVIDG